MRASPEPQAVLLIAHGSRQELANQEVREAALRLNTGFEGETVIACFLEIATPSIPEAFDQAVENGARQIKAVPFFLGTGAHVGEDLPRILNECVARHNPLQLEVELTPAVGPDPLLDEIVLRRIAGTG
jgi:sirohydrochlorin cobaltochelatase